MAFFVRTRRIPKRIRAFIPPSVVAAVGDVTTALTGVLATCTAGLLGVSRTLGLTGIAATCTAGLLSVARSLGLTGAAGTASVGTLTPSRSLGVSGVAGTGSVGTLALASTTGVSGVSGTGSVGTLSPGTAVGGLTNYLALTLDMNTSIKLYLQDYYSTTYTDLNQPLQRYLREGAGDTQNKWQTLYRRARGDAS